jgi:hypothetical protein
MSRRDSLREHVLYLLGGGGAHIASDEAIAGVPPELRGRRPLESLESPWRILEHLRIAQWDILEFCRNSAHLSPPFPAGYWPAGEAPPDDTAWDNSARAFSADLEAMQALVRDEENDLFTPIPHGDGQTLLREALLVADHNAYHLGQLVLVRKALGAWPPG